MNKDLAIRIVRVARAISKLKVAADDIDELNRKLNKVSQAINSGKLSPEQLQKASQMVISLTQSIINLQA